MSIDKLCCLLARVAFFICVAVGVFGLCMIAGCEGAKSDAAFLGLLLGGLTVTVAGFGSAWMIDNKRD